MKSGNLNFLEPSGPLQACNGTDLLLVMHGHTNIKPMLHTKIQFLRHTENILFPLEKLIS